jgi:hypothetical protein
LGDLGPSQEGCEDVSLDLAKGDRRFGEPSLGEVDSVEGVLPALVGQSPVGRPLVFDEAVAVGVSELLDPCQRSVGVR